MAFSTTCESVKYNGKGILSCSARKLDNKTMVQATLNLDEHIGFVDGKLVWGNKGFSAAAESVVIAGASLIAKFKISGKLVESKLDLNQYIKNVNGTLEPIVRPSSVASPKKPEPIKTPSAPELIKGLSTASTASAASATSVPTTFSHTSSLSSATSVSSASTSKTSFSSSSFRRVSKDLLVQDSCIKLELKGTVLHADCHRLDGSVAHSHLNLDEIIGLVDGQLVWDHRGFSKHCFEYSLDNFFLVVKCRVHAGEQYHISRIDLRTRIRNRDGILLVIELNQKLSVMLSEVPWMKFKIIAEPDLSVFAKHPVMQETLTRIAETTVEHVTLAMHEQLTIAMQAAIAVVTESAMHHVSEQMQMLVTGAVRHASASASITGPEHLHLFGHGGAPAYDHFHGYAHGNGSFYTNGHSHAAYEMQSVHANGHVEHMHEHGHEDVKPKLLAH
ncbi:hypothetical protein CPB84DRAFT_1845204 [Gymnopilus junonius]|uniref:Cyanovirin-N domain-containing protein n=1 Tax=Gymnopilus junonius TaxID=109634 RepID=A0A9P5TR61_GYMJU|nr:hypothetical protein CPB84DRAFT_1845204 [Gymnopilus junonius]